MEHIPNQDNGLLRFMTCGSVDDGKSTLIGRLLYDTKTILADALSAIEKTSKKRGLEAVDLSLLTDGLQAEREQGITIDVAYRYFSTGTRKTSPTATSRPARASTSSPTRRATSSTRATWSPPHRPRISRSS
jgi:hypothetical protein